MSINPRHEEILTLLHKLRFISVGQLTERLGVSTVTIRKDLTILEEQGFLLRTHGGAKLAENRMIITALPHRRNQNRDRKLRICEKACDFIREGDSIYIDAGTTTALLAALIRDRSLKVLTNSLEVMTELAGAADISLVAAGGNYRRDGNSFIGPIAQETIRQFQITTCFMGTTAFSGEAVFSAQNIIESQLKKTVLSVSSRKIILTDSSKYNADAFCVFARPEDIDILITDSDFNDVKKLEQTGLEIITV
ncbi:MAG: DeoR/GlpR transcriptional regulator [Spirochaetales bacterium]|nr:DeoR/GlpR transcriptional regulator [Spirochaetales bacterium]